MENTQLGPGSWSEDMKALRGSVLNKESDLFDDDWDVIDCWATLKQKCESLADVLGEDCLAQALEHGSDMGSLVRACPDDARDGFKSLKYARWFQPARDMPACIHTLPEAGNIRVLSQFRCGAHHLHCEAARHLGPRSVRVCSFCSLQEVEDELHVLYCPAWVDLRASFPELFQCDMFVDLSTALERGDDVDSAAWSFFNCLDPCLLDQFAGFLKKLFAARQVAQVQS